MKAVIFDLDGTLLDTLDDLMDSCNATMQHFSFPLHTKEEIRNFVGNGLGVLIEKAIPGGKENEKFEEALDYMRRHYATNWQNKPRPYDGVLALINELNERGIKTGIVSNKPDEQVKELASLYFSSAISPETAIGEKEAEGIRRKPWPDSVLAVMEKLSVKKEDCVYVGDSDVDLATAKNAGLKCISVCWGFRSESFLKEHGATTLIHQPRELLNLI